MLAGKCAAGMSIDVLLLNISCFGGAVERAKRTADGTDSAFVITIEVVVSIGI
ncbi:MAG: hypothetical protein ACLFQX_12550 [Candidatus Kapaibacterium sp.]